MRGMKKQPKLIIGIAPDSFKGTLTALEAAECIETGLKQALKHLVVRKIPMADGGEGTVQTIVEATGGKIHKRRVSGPLGRPAQAFWGMTGDGHTAVIEMACASGLALLKSSEYNPLKTSTRGTGELICAALDKGARKILIGIGGSATNDGGMGMARALGVRFLDARGKELPEGGGALEKLESIDIRGLDQRICKTVVEVACDVDNPLTGKRGAAAVYGPQKGASPEMVRQLDNGLKNFARVIKRDLGISIGRVPGAGAAGGLGGGLMAFLGGELRPGVDIVMDAVQLRRRLKDCRLVITGEGRMDGQTVNGKTPSGVARTAVALGIPVVAIAGCLGDDVYHVRSIGIDAYFSTQKHNVTEEELPKIGAAALVECAEQVGRLLGLGSALAVSGRHH